MPLVAFCGAAAWGSRRSPVEAMRRQACPAVAEWGTWGPRGAAAWGWGRSPVEAMEPTLLLNATYEPLTVVDWRKAMTLWCQGKVEVISVYPREVHSVSLTVKLPSVIRLLRYITIKRHFNLVPFSRANIYARDNHRCQYCAKVLPADSLTFDHVVPVRNGGRKEWENIVTSCVRCNRRKGGRTPTEARMTILRPPRRPLRSATVRIAIGVREAPEGWRDYLFWNVELGES